MKRYPYILLLCLAALTLVFGPGFGPAWARDKKAETQDEVLSGFGDDKPVEPKRKMSGGDDPLSGFDEEPGPAQGDPPGTDDPLAGFEEEEKTNTVSKASPKPGSLPGWLDLGGSLSLSTGFNLDRDPPLPGMADYRYLSRLRTELNLEADLRLSSTWKARFSGHAFYDFSYPIKGRGIFAEEALESLEREVELDEAWIQGSLFSNLDLKFGRQVVVWGRSDNLRVTDVLNPLDSREPGLTDLEDIRLPTTMTRLDLYLGQWSLSGIMVHEVRFSKYAPWGGDFYPVPYFPPESRTPDFNLENQEYGLALTGLFSGWDISLYGAYYFGEQRVEVSPQGFGLVHDRNWMAGAAANVVLGSWLFKAEAAVVGGLKFANLPGTDRTRLDLMAGVEYTGFKNTTLALEVVNRHIFDYQDVLALDPDEYQENGFQSAFRISRTFLNETLEISFLASTYGLTGDRGGFQRLQVKYDWTDNLILSLGAINYTEGDKIFFRNIGDKDRVYLELRYHF